MNYELSSLEAYVLLAKRKQYYLNAHIDKCHTLRQVRDMYTLSHLILFQL